MTPLQRHWLSMAYKHGLRIDVPFILQFPDGTTITAEVRLQGYGAKNGMLLVSDYTVVEKKSDEIVKMGHGYSWLSQPSKDEIDSDEELKDLLDDWGKNET